MRRGLACLAALVCSGSLFAERAEFLEAVLSDETEKALAMMEKEGGGRST